MKYLVGYCVACQKAATGTVLNFVKFIGKHLCWSLFLIKLQAVRPATSLKRNSSTGVFLWLLKNFQEHIFLLNASGLLLLVVTKRIIYLRKSKNTSELRRVRYDFNQTIECRSNPLASFLAKLVLIFWEKLGFSVYISSIYL